MSLPALVDRLAGHPAVYDLVQRLAGRDEITRRMEPWLAGLSGLLLDIGGGTGQLHQRFDRRVNYVCIDLEARKLLALKRKSASAIVLQADGLALPLASGAADAAVLIAVLHHVPDERIRMLYAEIHRVLAPGGQLIVLDAIWAPRRLIGRVLWAMDRGSHPRPLAAIEGVLREWFEVVNGTTFTVFHEYCIFRCRKVRP
jgi:SAM-dependent methyltransferase